MDSFEKFPSLEKESAKSGSDPVLLDEIGRANILVLEDELLMSSLLLRYLESIGQTQGLGELHPVNLSSGWELLKVDLSHIRVAIVDILLPQVTGVDLIRDFRHRFPKMGLVPISGMATSPMRRQLKEMLPGHSEVLDKPLRKEAFVQAFTKAWHFNAESPAGLNLPSKPLAAHDHLGMTEKDDSPVWSAGVSNTDDISVVRRRSLKKKIAA